VEPLGLDVQLSGAAALRPRRRGATRHGQGADVNLPRIDKPATASQLRDRVLCQMNGETRCLSKQDRDRRRRVLEALQQARKRSS
jgi:hypothetical protein